MNQPKECLIGLPGRKELINLYCMPPEVMNLGNIIETLSRFPRFGARGINQVSVLRHSYFVSSIIRKWGFNEAEQLGGLCHDFSESFMGDMINPLKRMCPEYQELERRVMSQISTFINCGNYDSDIVKAADIKALRIEAEYAGFIIDEWNLPFYKEEYESIDIFDEWFQSSHIEYTQGKVFFLNIMKSLTKKGF